MLRSILALFICTVFVLFLLRWTQADAQRVPCRPGHTNYLDAHYRDQALGRLV